MIYTNEEIVHTFDRASMKVAEFISLLSDFKGKFERISDQTLDNADPLCESAECLEKLGILLATLTIYKNEYQNDPIDKKTGRLENKNE